MDYISKDYLIGILKEVRSSGEQRYGYAEFHIALLPVVIPEPGMALPK